MNMHNVLPDLHSTSIHHAISSSYTEDTSKFKRNNNTRIWTRIFESIICNNAAINIFYKFPSPIPINAKIIKSIRSEMFESDRKVCNLKAIFDEKLKFLYVQK